MIRWFPWLAILVCCVAGPGVVPATAAGGTGSAPALRSYEDWVAACRGLPANRKLRGAPPPAERLPLPRFAEFDAVLTAFLHQCRTGALSQTHLWIGPAPATDTFFNTDSGYFLAPGAPAGPFLRPFLAGTPVPRNPAPVPFQPFVQKVRLPDHAEVYFHADLHGDIHSLLADLAWLNTQGYLRGFDIVKPGFHLVFLGDYTDRGSYGVEVLYTLLRLRLANPERVLLARGNHEESSLAARYGFLSEGRLKYGADFNVAKILRAYDFLPVALWLDVGGHHVQCHHGGLEPGFDPRSLLGATGPVAFQFIGTLRQRAFLSGHPEWFGADEGAARALYLRAAQDFQPVDPINPATLGFMWNDFTLTADEPAFAVDPGRAYVYGQSATRKLLELTRSGTNVIHAIFRGHQQASAPNPMMRRLLAGRGVFRHWQPADSTARHEAPVRELETFLERGEERPVPPGSVWTFNISPDSLYGEANGFTYDTFGLLKTAPNPADWRLRVVNVEVRP